MVILYLPMKNFGIWVEQVFFYATFSMHYKTKEPCCKKLENFVIEQTNQTHQKY